MNVKDMPHAYTYGGGNPAGPGAYYRCDECDLDLQGDEVRYVGAGRRTANGEHGTCPRCASENRVFWR